MRSFNNSSRSTSFVRLKKGSTPEYFLRLFCDYGAAQKLQFLSQSVGGTLSKLKKRSLCQTKRFFTKFLLIDMSAG